MDKKLPEQIFDKNISRRILRSAEKNPDAGERAASYQDLSLSFCQAIHPDLIKASYKLIDLVAADNDPVVQVSCYNSLSKIWTSEAAFKNLSPEQQYSGLAYFDKATTWRPKNDNTMEHLAGLSILEAYAVSGFAKRVDSSKLSFGMHTMITTFGRLAEEDVRHSVYQTAAYTLATIQSDLPPIARGDLAKLILDKIDNEQHQSSKSFNQLKVDIEETLSTTEIVTALWQTNRYELAENLIENRIIPVLTATKKESYKNS